MVEVNGWPAIPAVTEFVIFDFLIATGNAHGSGLVFVYYAFTPPVAFHASQCISATDSPRY
jgi:hypothetical protein